MLTAKNAQDYQYTSGMLQKNKVRRFKEEKYYGKPLSGFGDVNAKLLIVGLAPAAHGGNRTGRMFTGDSSGDWVAKSNEQVWICIHPN